MDKISELVGCAGDPLGLDLLRGNFEKIEFPTPLGDQLADLLTRKNGFYAFESSLHILPLGGGQGVDIMAWNSPGLWKSEYGDLIDNLFFFAEDIFGNQFSLTKDGVVLFDSETAVCTRISPDLEGWSDCVLTDYNYLTGFPLAHEWQKKNGTVSPGKRLMPRIPFVCGGKFEIANLVMIDAVEGMRWRGNLARQIKNLPDGSRIDFKVLNQE